MRQAKRTAGRAIEFQMESWLMSQINYDSMSTTELKQYFLKHRGDGFAFQARVWGVGCGV